MNYKNYGRRWVLMGVSALALYVGLAVGPAQGREHAGSAQGHKRDLC